MADIKIKRGRHEVTYKKMKNYFAVRLNKGRARDRQSLEAACGPLKHAADHIDCVGPAKMDLFVSQKATELEGTMDELRTASASDVVSHVYSIKGSEDSALVPTGVMTLQFVPNTKKEACEKILEEFGLEVMNALDTLPLGYNVRLTRASKMNPLKIAAALQKKKVILVAEPDMGFQVSFQDGSSDALYNDQWHLKNSGDRMGMKEGADVSAEGAWAISKGTRGITVAVIDDGFDLNHSDFQGEDKIVAPRDFGERDFDPTPVDEEDNHGTSCAGVAIAEENGSGVVGLAPRCAFMPIRMGTWLTDQSIEEMFRYVMTKKADVVSCSWSAGAWNFPLSARMDAIIHKAAVEGRHNNKGCVILFAAGNENRPLNGTKAGKISQQGFALHPDVIAVAASNSLDKRSSYSNFGPEITLCAPSNGSPGWGIVTTDRSGGKGYSTEDYTYGFGGTSSATPLAAGLAGLILSVNPNLTSAEVKQIMMDGADKIDEENGEYVEGHSPYFGGGRINAQKSLELLTQPKPSPGPGPQPGLPKTLYVEHRVNTPIPDLGHIEETIPFPLNTEVDGIEVNVNIKHTFKGDLRLTLTSPSGSEILLLSHTSEGGEDLVRTFRSSNDSELFASVIGAPAQGDWRLKVEDMMGQDEGTLIHWGLSISYS